VLDAAAVEKFAAERIGRFEQMPPSFSAKKVKGRPAYELARKKQAVELKAVEVEIYEYKLREIEGGIARFVIECSSGTYIRSLAHEMGRRLDAARTWRKSRARRWESFRWNKPSRSKNSPKPSRPGDSRTV